MTLLRERERSDDNDVRAFFKATRVRTALNRSTAAQNRARIVFDCRTANGFRFLNAERFGTIPVRVFRP